MIIINFSPNFIRNTRNIENLVTKHRTAAGTSTSLIVFNQNCQYGYILVEDKTYLVPGTGIRT
jgi:hypothetical protein